MPDTTFSITQDGLEYKTQIHINLNPSDDKTFENCIKSVGDSQYAFSSTVNDMIFFFEEQMLNDLNNNTDSTKKIQSLFSNLMSSLGVNFYIYIGHINLCENFVNDLTEKISRETPENPLFGNKAPVIVLFIACKGTEQAETANNSEIWKNTRFIAMGFENLVHIYEGDIFMCKESHFSLPNMACFYDGVEADYKKIMESANFDEADYDRLKKEMSDNPLVQCCESKIDRFRGIFLQYFRKRNCVVFTEDQLKSKIRNLLTSDGSINSYKKSIFENYVFSLRDGTPCDNETGCPITNPYEAQIQVADNFNSQSTIFKLYNELEAYAYKKDISREQKDKATLKKLQNLRPEERAVMNFIYQGATLLHSFASNGLLKSMEYMIKKGLPRLEAQGNITGDTYLHKLIESTVISDDNEIMPFLFEALDARGQAFFSIQNNQGDDVLSLAVYFHRFAVVQFYARKIYRSFANLIYGDGYNLLFQACSFYPLFSERALKLVQLLCAMGTDVNHIYKGQDFFHYYVDIWHPPYSRKIFKEICNYKFIYINDINNIIQQLTDTITNQVKFIQTKQEILDTIEFIEQKSLQDPNTWAVQKLGDETHLEMLELLQLDVEKQYKDAIAIFKECREIVARGGKKNIQLNNQSVRVISNTRRNVNKKNLEISSKQQIPEYYHSIDEFLKVLGTTLSAQEKKEYRRRGVEFVRNNAGNSVERLQGLRNLLEEIEEVAVKRGYYHNASNVTNNTNNSYGYRSGWGGRRYKKTRKNLKPRRTRRKATK